MKLYRSVNEEQIDTNEYIDTTSFSTNKDSEIKAGSWSFWFNRLIKLVDGMCVVMSEFEPCGNGLMTYRIDTGGGNEQELQVEEFVTSKPQKIIKIYVNQWFTFADKHDSLCISATDNSVYCGGNKLSDDFLDDFDDDFINEIPVSYSSDDSRIVIIDNNNFEHL